MIVDCYRKTMPLYYHVHILPLALGPGRPSTPLPHFIPYTVASDAKCQNSLATVFISSLNNAPIQTTQRED